MNILKTTVAIILGALIMLVALSIDPLIIFVVGYLIYSTQSLIVIILTGILGYAWLTTKKETSKPFDCWKPSKIKQFWKNWMELNI